MKLTKSERHTAYIILHEKVNEIEKHGYDCFLCLVAKDVFGWGLHTCEWVLKRFPELLKHKPTKLHESGGWLHQKDYKTRKSILKQCIIETA